MDVDEPTKRALTPGPCASPAEPLWRLAPTRGKDGRSLADFMMLIPGLARKPQACRERVAALIREVGASYGARVAFADINYRFNG